MNNKRRNRKSDRGIRSGVFGRLFAQTKLPAHVTEEQDWYLDTPDVRLTRVFTIVLILHVVAVGGILAFKMIEKATTPGSVATVSTPAATASARNESTAPAPATTNEIAAGGQATPAVVATDSAPGVIEYRVAGTESLVDISRKMGVSVAAIKAENDISNSFQPGDWIRVTSKKIAVATAAPEVAGSRPAATTAVAAARVDNPAPAPAPVAATRRPASASAAAASTTAPKTYVVKKGDTAYGIARKFGVKHTTLMAENGISRPELMQLGQTLKIPGN
ncbi:MAG: LysM peptidoglycan-binding domain-containing protein [Verrucomicrobiales bacterium]